MKVRLLTTMIVSIFVLVSQQAIGGIVDDFEYTDQEAFNAVWPYSAWSPASGINLSTAQNHTVGGSKSVAVDNDYGTNRGVERSLVESPVIGTVVFWVYDSADSSTNNNGVWVGVINTAASYRSWSLGVTSGDTYQSDYWYDLAGTKVDTGVARTEGWHEFKFEVGTDAAGGATNVRYFIDGVAVHTQWYGTGNVFFDTARIMSNPGTKSTAPFYVDDFSTSIPEPVAFASLAFMGYFILMKRKFTS